MLKKVFFRMKARVIKISFILYHQTRIYNTYYFRKEKVCIKHPHVPLSNTTVYDKLYIISLGGFMSYHCFYFNSA